MFLVYQVGGPRTPSLVPLSELAPSGDIGSALWWAVLLGGVLRMRVGAVICSFYSGRINLVNRPCQNLERKVDHITYDKKAVTQNRPWCGPVFSFIFTGSTECVAQDGNITIVLLSNFTVSSISWKCKSPPVKARGS